MTNYQYQVGGTLSGDAPTYVELVLADFVENLEHFG